MAWDWALRRPARAAGRLALVQDFLNTRAHAEK